METRKAELLLVRAGFVLFTLALLTGLAVPTFLNTRMALASHLTGVLNALVLIALGLTWGYLAAGPVQARLTRAAFLYGAYASWGTSCLAAAWGTSRLTPLAGAGHNAAPWKEMVVQGLQGSIVVVILAGAMSVVYALRPMRPRVPAG
jgi:hydroxylaminobenzene mutase